MNIRNFAFGFALVGLGLLAPEKASAAPLIYGNPGVICPTSDPCNGATWTASLFTVSAPDQFKIVVTMDPTSATPGALGAIALKTFYQGGSITWTGFTASGGTNNPTWVRLNDELNANGCDGGGSGSYCAEVDPGPGAPYSSVSPFFFDPTGGNVTFSWFFTASGGNFTNSILNGAGTHLKYQFLAPKTDKDDIDFYDKAGDLGSYEIRFSNYTCCTVPTTEQVVPEPSTYGLVAAAAIMMSLRRRFKK